jgi:hypothetical protein
MVGRPAGRTSGGVLISKRPSEEVERAVQVLILIKSEEDMINPESSDPKDPETNTWWIWIPIFITLVILFGTLVFERDFLYESRVETTSVTRTV